LFAVAANKGCAVNFNRKTLYTPGPPFAATLPGNIFFKNNFIWKIACEIKFAGQSGGERRTKAFFNAV
jgi:hypothetical protein